MSAALHSLDAPGSRFLYRKLYMAAHTLFLEPRSHGLSAPITSLQQGLDITITYIGPSFSLNIPIFGDGHQPDNMHGFTVKTAGIEIAIIANDPATGVPITVSIIFTYTDVMAAANAARARRTEE